MKTIRRLYFYAVAAISIEVVLWGIIGLIRSIFNTQDISNNASNLAQALALIFVGVPIFLIHWFWTQRASATDAEEHSASIRAVFLYGILLGTLIPVIQNLLAFINRTILFSTHLSVARAVVGGSQTWVDNLIAVIVNLLIAAYFWNVLKSDWSSLAETENFAEIRRLYRFIWVLYGLLMTVYGTQQALTYVFAFPGNVLGTIGKETAVNAIALMLIGAPIWYFTWRLLQDALADPAEKESYLRLGILYLLTLGGVIVSLVSAGELTYLILLRLFGSDESTAEFIRLIGGPIAVGVPLGVVWMYYGTWLNRQFAFDENGPRREGKQRLYTYILSFLGLASSTFGVLALFSVLIDLALGDSFLSEQGIREPLAGAFATLAVGLPVWLTTWRPMQAQALTSADTGDHARRSLIRKSYLYLVLFVSVIGGMGTAGALVFELINMALGGSSTFSLKDALNELTALATFAVLLVYHLSVLRKDGVTREDALTDKQSNFHVVVFDHDGKFGEAVKAVFAKRAPDVPVRVLTMNEAVPEDVQADAVVLPSSVAVDLPVTAAAWVRSFGGSRFIVSDEAAGVFWMGDSESAADSAKAMAEGEDVRPPSSKRMTSVWTYVAYVFAGLFACQLVFMLLLFGVSMVAGF